MWLLKISGSNCWFSFLRLQHASVEQRPASGNHPQTHWNTEAGDSFGDLHAAEQPAVRRLVQPGRSHLPGTAGGALSSDDPRNCVTLSVTRSGADASFLACNQLAPPFTQINYSFSHFVSVRWRISWRSWRRLCSQYRCWAANWGPTSGSHCWSSWLEWLSCRSSTASCFFSDLQKWNMTQNIVSVDPLYGAAPQDLSLWCKV